MANKQAPFSVTPPTLREIENSLSTQRFNRYLRQAGGDHQKAVRLYVWNAKLAGALQWPLHLMEVVCRNGTVRALEHKFGKTWHTDQAFLSMLKFEDSNRLNDAVQRQIVARRTSRPTVDQIVADLNFGFWVSLLSNRYEIPLGWPTRLVIAYPSLPVHVNRNTLHQKLEPIQKLRNRVAHNEPILGPSLEQQHKDLVETLAWIAPNMQWLLKLTDEFPTIHAAGP